MKKTVFLRLISTCGLIFSIFFNLNCQNLEIKTGTFETPLSKINKIQADIELAEGLNKQKLDSFDLCQTKRFPPPLNQGSSKACTSFTLSYALKTFQEAEDQNYSIYDNNGDPIDSLIFSPSFLFKVIKNGTGDKCQKGVDIADALMHLQDHGTISISDSPFNIEELNSNCLEPTEFLEKAKQYRIANYYRLSKKRSQNPERRNGQWLDIIDRIKSRITNYNPIVFGSYLNRQFIKQDYNKFNTSDGLPIWDSKKEKTQNYHAMLIVGFNDKLGAFKIFNSWGKYGLIWMQYDVFKKYTTNDIYVTTDVPFENQKNPVNLFADKQQDLNITEKKSIKGSFTLAAGIKEHHYMETDNFKISNLNLINENQQTFIEILDKKNNSNPIKMILNVNEEQHYTIGEKEYSIKIDSFNNEKQIVYFDFNVLDKEIQLEQYLENLYPIKLSTWNSGRINGEALRFRNVRATLSRNGIFSVEAIQTNNQIFGWHGRLIFEILDLNGNVLKTITTPRYGQNGTFGTENKRDIIFNTRIDDSEILKQARKIRPSAIKD